MANRNTEKKGNKELYVKEAQPMDRTIGKSQKRNNDGERPMKILNSYSQMAKSLYMEAVVADDKLNEYSISDSDNLWDSNGVEDRQAIMKALKKDSKIMKKIGPKPYWDDIDLVADNDDGDTVVSLRRNMTFRDLKKAILKWRG